MPKAPFLAVGVALFFVIPFAHAEDPRVTKQLQDALEKSKSTLGKLQPFQEEVFSNEVLPSTGRFIRDYTAKNGKASNIQVDVEGLKRYLAFSANAAGLSAESRRVLLSVSLDGECEGCAKAIPQIRKEWKERLVRRGLEPIILTPGEAKKDPTDLLAPKNAGAWFALRVNAENDPDHVGETTVKAKLDIKFPSSNLSTVSREVEVPERDPIDVTVSRLFVEGITQLGADSVKTASTGNAADPAFFRVAVRGIASYNELEAKKDALAAADESVRVVEYELTKEVAVFAVSPASARGHYLNRLKSGGRGQILGPDNVDVVEVSVNVLPPAPGAVPVRGASGENGGT